MTDTRDFDDPDQADQAMMEGLKAQGIDTAKVIAITTDLGFYSEQAARQAAVELILASYAAVKVASSGSNVGPILLLQLTSWTTTVTANMAPTLDALRSVRRGLGEFAVSRGGKYAGGGVGLMPETDEWANVELRANDPASDDQEDQGLIDHLFAYDSDLKQVTLVTTALHYGAEDVARQAAAALIGAGYAEVRVNPANVGWTVAVDTYLVPKLEAIRTLRLNLTKFAQSGGGSWAGCMAGLAMPKGFDEQPS